MSEGSQHAGELVGTETQRFAVEVERGRLALFAKAIGETDPIFSDRDAAIAAGYGDVVAPPTFLYCLSEDVPDPDKAIHLFGFSAADVFHAEQVVDLDRPIIAGDKLYGRTWISDYFEKKNGQLKFIVTQTDFVDSDDRNVGKLITTVVHTKGK